MIETLGKRSENLFELKRRARCILYFTPWNLRSFCFSYEAGGDGKVRKYYGITKGQNSAGGKEKDGSSITGLFPES